MDGGFNIALVVLPIEIFQRYLLEVIQCKFVSLFFAIDLKTLTNLGKTKLNPLSKQKRKDLKFLE